ncbi:class I SAM-dependent methyltransferase [Brucella endophytica]|uniref:class I SAM-dependent methyltransferase n=1 Tax=Brucella endophytica TaxID=1963359 RepID=UPI003571197A
MEEVFRFLESHGIELRSNERCLDFGCGVGRVTQALATKFHKAIGIDISPTMIAKAENYREKNGCGNADFILTSSSDLLSNFSPSAIAFRKPKLHS